MILTDLAKEKKMRLIVGRISNLPTPSAIFTEITKMISDPNVATADIARVISNDPALSVKVLKLTNSSFYGIPRTITNIRQAIVILGFEAVKSLILSASVFDMFSKKYNLDNVFLEHFWRHSLSVAFMSQIISRLHKSSLDIDAEMTFTEGLLHDIGKLIILAQFPKERGAINSIIVQESEKSQSQAEEQVLGFSHADIGAYLCSKWNLPDIFCETIMNHHDAACVSSNPNTALVHLSNYLAHKMDSLYNGYPPDSSAFYDGAWSVLGLFPEQEMQLIEMLQQDYIKAEAFLNIATGAD